MEGEEWVKGRDFVESKKVGKGGGPRVQAGEQVSGLKGVSAYRRGGVGRSGWEE